MNDTMWIADQWKDYELIDCSRGEKLERWGEVWLVRPDPQAIWDTPRKTGIGNSGMPAISAASREAEAGRRRAFRKAGRCITANCASV